MARPSLDLTRKIKDILAHTEPLPPESRSPILHHDQTSAAIMSSLAYVERSFGFRETYPAVAGRHLTRLYGMALISLIENFERFLKELAAECIDVLAPAVADDRFGVFERIQAATVAAHFGADTLGKALCESSTWLDCEEINKRFRRLLSDPFQTGDFYLFPRSKQAPVAECWRYEPMAIIWQLRNTAVHNVGAITQSDSVKLRLLAREAVTAPRLLAPERNDLRYLKRFLDDTANSCNRRVGIRLAELLTLLCAQAPALIDPQPTADRLAANFQLPLAVAGSAGVVSDI